MLSSAARVAGSGAARSCASADFSCLSRSRDLGFGRLLVLLQLADRRLFSEVQVRRRLGVRGCLSGCRVGGDRVENDRLGLEHQPCVHAPGDHILRGETSRSELGYRRRVGHPYLRGHVVDPDDWGRLGEVEPRSPDDHLSRGRVRRGLSEGVGERYDGGRDRDGKDRPFPPPQDREVVVEIQGSGVRHLAFGSARGPDVS